MTTNDNVSLSILDRRFSLWSLFFFYDWCKWRRTVVDWYSKVICVDIYISYKNFLLRKGNPKERRRNLEKNLLNALSFLQSSCNWSSNKHTELLRRDRSAKWLKRKKKNQQRSSRMKHRVNIERSFIKDTHSIFLRLFPSSFVNFKCTLSLLCMGLLLRCYFGTRFLADSSVIIILCECIVTSTYFH